MTKLEMMLKASGMEPSHKTEGRASAKVPETAKKTALKKEGKTPTAFAVENRAFHAQIFEYDGADCIGAKTRNVKRDDLREIIRANGLSYDGSTDDGVFRYKSDNMTVFVLPFEGKSLEDKYNDLRTYWKANGYDDEFGKMVWAFSKFFTKSFLNFEYGKIANGEPVGREIHRLASYGVSAMPDDPSRESPEPPVVKGKYTDKKWRTALERSHSLVFSIDTTDNKGADAFMTCVGFVCNNVARYHDFGKIAPMLRKELRKGFTSDVRFGTMGDTWYKLNERKEFVDDEDVDVGFSGRRLARSRVDDCAYVENDIKPAINSDGSVDLATVDLFETLPVTLGFTTEETRVFKLVFGLGYSQAEASRMMGHKSKDYCAKYVRSIKTKIVQSGIHKGMANGICSNLGMEDLEEVEASKRPENMAKGVRVFDMESGDEIGVFESYGACARELGISDAFVRACLKGTRNSKKYIFKKIA